MKTKLISFALILILSVPLAIGQSSENGKMSFALLGGINFQNLNGKDINGDKLANDMILGFHAGVNAQIPIAPEFYFQPGLLFTTKGAKNADGSSTKLSYIELPLNMVYKALVGNGKFMLGFGPYLGYAIGGKVIAANGSEADIEFKNTIDTETEDPTRIYRAFDAGGNIFAGYELPAGIFLQMNTQFGMVKINPDSGDSSNKTSIRNSGFGLSIGYRF
ncbi:MAG: PorT family protein [Ignavibacteriales bacterium]|nr:MAG: PorT family protein [Ignavibacteriales bacterium]